MKRITAAYVLRYSSKQAVNLGLFNENTSAPFRVDLYWIEKQGFISRIEFEKSKHVSYYKISWIEALRYIRRYFEK